MDSEVIWRTLNDLANEMREVRAELEEIAERVMARSHMVNGEVAGAMQRVASRNLLQTRSRGPRGS